MLQLKSFIEDSHICVCPKCHIQVCAEMIDRTIPIQHIQAPGQLYQDVWEYYIECPNCHERLSLGIGIAPLKDCVAMSLARMKGGCNALF